MTKEPITPDWSGPVCIVRLVGEQKQVMCEHDSDNARVFKNIKSARNWVKRNIPSPSNRRELFFVEAPRD